MKRVRVCARVCGWSWSWSWFGWCSELEQGSTGRQAPAGIGPRRGTGESVCVRCIIMVWCVCGVYQAKAHADCSEILRYRGIPRGFRSPIYTTRDRHLSLRRI